MNIIRMNIRTIIGFGLTLSFVISGILSFILVSLILIITNISLDQDRYVVFFTIVFWVLIQLYFWSYKISFDNKLIIIRNSIFEYTKSSINIMDIKSVSIQLGLAKNEKKSFYTMWLKSSSNKIQINVKLFSTLKIIYLLKHIQKINPEISFDKRCNELLKSYKDSKI